MSIPWGVSLVHCFQVEFKVGNVGFCEWRKTGEKSSEPTREPTTNSTFMWRHVRASNLGHSGGRQVRLPKRHPRYSYLKKNNFHRVQRSMQPKQTIWIIEFTSSREKFSLRNIDAETKLLHLHWRNSCFGGRLKRILVMGTSQKI